MFRLKNLYSKGRIDDSKSLKHVTVFGTMISLNELKLESQLRSSSEVLFYVLTSEKMKV